MDEVWAWVEDQRVDNRSRFDRFLAEQRKIWTPSRVFRRCCVKWIADGAPLPNDYDFYDEYSFRNGCCRLRCSRDHPKITLSFDSERNVTLATMSHQLDPFCNYFSQRLEEETAWPQSAFVYQLDGFLRPNLTNLRETFKSHLISVSSDAIASSDRAQSEMQEECDTKRPRIEHPVLVFDRLEQVLDIVLLHYLERDLDPISILCMSRTSRMFLRKARGIASQRLGSARLSITPMVDGMELHGESKMDSYDPETCDHSGSPFEQRVWSYNKRKNIDLVFVEHDEEKGFFCPADQDASSSTFSWTRGDLSKTWQDEDDYNRRECEDDYVGQQFKLYWHPHPHDGVEVPSRYNMYQGVSMPSLGVLLGKVDIGINPPEGLTRKKLEVEYGRSNAETAYVEYEVLHSSQEVREQEGEDDESEEEYADGESTEENKSDGVHIEGNESDERSTLDNDGQSNKEYTVDFSGQACFKRLKINFGTLLSIMALQHLNKLKREHATILKTRPLRPTEVEMLAEVQKAVFG